MRARWVPSPPALAPFVEALWSYESQHAHAAETVLPSGRVQLLVNLSSGLDAMPGGLVTGPATRPVRVPTAAMRHVVGAAFRPGGAAPFVAVPCTELVDRNIDLEALWGRQGRTVRQRLLEAPDPLVALAALLIARAGERLVLDPVVAYGVAALERGTPVRTVVATTGWSRATVVRRFAGAVGLSPKQYAGVARFQRAVRGLASGGTAAAVAAECGYFDQAHLTRDFARYAGCSPGRYRPRSPDEPNHVATLAP